MLLNSESYIDIGSTNMTYIVCLRISVLTAYLDVAQWLEHRKSNLKTLGSGSGTGSGYYKLTGTNSGYNIRQLKTGECTKY